MYTRTYIIRHSIRTYTRILYVLYVYICVYYTLQIYTGVYYMRAYIIPVYIYTRVYYTYALHLDSNVYPCTRGKVV